MLVYYLGRANVTVLEEGCWVSDIGKVKICDLIFRAEYMASLSDTTWDMA